MLGPSVCWPGQGWPNVVGHGLTNLAGAVRVLDGLLKSYTGETMDPLSANFSLMAEVTTGSDMAEWDWSQSVQVGYWNPLNLSIAEFWGQSWAAIVGFLQRPEIKHGRVLLAGFIGYWVAYGPFGESPRTPSWDLVSWDVAESHAEQKALMEAMRLHFPSGPAGPTEWEAFYLGWNARGAFAKKRKLELEQEEEQKKKNDKK